MGLRPPRWGLDVTRAVEMGGREPPCKPKGAHRPHPLWRRVRQREKEAAAEAGEGDFRSRSPANGTSCASLPAFRICIENRHLRQLSGFGSPGSDKWTFPAPILDERHYMEVYS